MSKFNTNNKVVAQNRKARHDYFIVEAFECGIVLTGTEIKSVRAGSLNLKDSYKNGECEITEEVETDYRYTERINISNRYGREVEKYQAWKEFCNDGELKLLKDVKGNSWIVQIVDNPSNSIANNIHSMPTTISFNWKEVLNTEDISIVEKEE